MSDTQKNVSFALGEYERAFISNMVEEGRFGNRTEVVRASLRLLEDYENNEKLKRLRSLIAVGDSDIQEGNYDHYESSADLLNDIID